MTYRENLRPEAPLRGPHPADAEPLRPWMVAVPSVILALVGALVGLDVLGDARTGSSPAHLVLEIAIMAFSLLGTVALWALLALARRRAGALGRDLASARADLARFRQESQDHLRGLGAAIDRQFERWALSPAEREIALLLLKGLSLKDVAALRETSERTVRQQALAIYRKAGLAGRAELAAFFLEDLLLPAPAEPRKAGS